MPEKLIIDNIIVELSNFHGRLQKGTDVTLCTAAITCTPKLQFGTGKTGYTRTRDAPTSTRPDP